MSIFISNGVFLQRVDTPEHVHIIIKLIRITDPSTRAAQLSTHAFSHAPSLILQVDNNGDPVRLDYDPWSAINVTPGNDIDERDIALITDLALAYFQQSIIDSEQAGYLYQLPADPPERRVNVEALEFDDDQQWYSVDVFETRSPNAGAAFRGIRRNPLTGAQFDYGVLLEKLIGAFIKLKL
ncbi:hypothetical protein SAMN04487857_103373 [Pseudomonas sp. ok272]|uniref:hypothetical protein n=1 Tax=unclassified Pseudomonas TaxID=196821 RepID=UPI0008AB1A06|nr:MULTISPECIES: hypothetical protein [unclassified Pseudomonas]SEM64197.1 hypothetical protein SAMN04487857_103373 [Pseudomonas sp. ok272]SFM45558.1 hypothetical protein SAMN04487858_10362 [Pseudomonas sp. ok602]